MKNKIILFAAFLSILVTACESRSYIVFEKTFHDFGKVKKNSTLSYTFNFKNEGLETLIIEKIKAG